MRKLALALAATVAIAACAEDVPVSRDEAVEILVLDGVPRERAICIVDGIDGQVGLDKVTGVDPDIDEADLASLATVSAGCVGLGGPEASVFDPDSAEAQLGSAEGGSLEQSIEERIEALITGGLDPMVGDCVRQAVESSSDPQGAIENPNFVSEAIRICDR